MFLRPDAEPVCVLVETSVDDLMLPYRFLQDLDELLGVNQRQLASCVLNFAASREHLNRVLNGDPDLLLRSNASYVILAQLLLRPEVICLPKQKGLILTPAKKAQLTQAYRTKVLELLWRYGVRCAGAPCCGLVRDHLTLEVTYATART